MLLAATTESIFGGQSMAVNVTPLHDRVILKRVQEGESIRGGIIIPDSAKEKPQEGEIIAAGAGRWDKGTRVPLDVKAGDRVLFKKWGGDEIRIDNEDYLILKEEDILAKLGNTASSKPAVNTGKSSGGKR